jgi:hypothetical protein
VFGADAPNFRFAVCAIDDESIAPRMQVSTVSASFRQGINIVNSIGGF